MNKRDATCKTPLTESERQELGKYVAANSEYFRYIALLCLTNSDDAEDVIQESLLRAMRHAGSFLLLDSRRRNAYIAKTIFNLCVDNYRHKQRVQLVPLEEELLEPAPAQFESVPGSDAHLSLLALGAGLRRREWYVLQQLYLEGASGIRVAKTLGCTPGSIRSMASRARASARRIVIEFSAG